MADKTMRQTTTDLLTDFASDVRRDLALTPKQLQSKYLCGAPGSSLFEAICGLPWYRTTRAEQGLLERHARTIVSRVCREPETVPLIVELGCGSGEKIVILAETLQAAGRHGRVHLIDISRQALEQSERTLGRLRHISVVGHRETYEVGLPPAGGPGRGAARAAARGACRRSRTHRPGRRPLPRPDLVKPEPVLQLAYDDPLGVTAAFNKNLLVRMNRELD